MTWEDRQRERRLKRAQRRQMARVADTIISYLGHAAINDCLAGLTTQSFTSGLEPTQPTRH